MKPSTENTKMPMEQAQEQLRILLGLKKTLQQYYKQIDIPSKVFSSIQENYKQALDNIAIIDLSDDDRYSINAMITYHQKINEELQHGDPTVSLVTQIKNAINPNNVENINEYDREQLTKLQVAISDPEISEEKCNERINHYLNKVDWTTDSLIRRAMKGINSPALQIPRGRIMGSLTNVLVGNRNPSIEESAISIKFSTAREESPLFKLMSKPIPPLKPKIIQENNELNPTPTKPSQ